jgi:hypothetical protein
MANERAGGDLRAGEGRGGQGWKAGMSEDPDSIFWIPFDKALGLKVKNSLVNIDRDFSMLRRHAGVGIDIDDVKGMEKKIAETGALVWGILVEAIPRLHNVAIERSRDLNDDKNEKRQKAKLFYSIGFLPRNQGVGHLAIVVKQMEEKVIFLQKTDLDGLKVILEAYNRICTQITQLEGDLSKIAPTRNKKGERVERVDQTEKDDKDNKKDKKDKKDN